MATSCLGSHHAGATMEQTHQRGNVEGNSDYKDLPRIVRPCRFWGDLFGFHMFGFMTMRTNGFMLTTTVFKRRFTAGGGFDDGGYL